MLVGSVLLALFLDLYKLYAQAADLAIRICNTFFRCLGKVADWVAHLVWPGSISLSFGGLCASLGRVASTWVGSGEAARVPLILSLVQVGSRVGPVQLPTLVLGWVSGYLRASPLVHCRLHSRCLVSPVPGPGWSMSVAQGV